MWSLRQPIEGDKFITVSDVDDSIGNCWIDSQGNYVPNSIAISIDDVEYPLYFVYELKLGFLTIKIPNDVYINAGTKVQVYSKCNPTFITYEQFAKSIKFSISTITTPTECNPNVLLSPIYENWIRIYMGVQDGYFFKASLFDINIGTPYVHLVNFFEHEPYNTGGLATFLDSPNNTVFHRSLGDPYYDVPAILFSKLSSPLGGATFSVNAYPDKYFTIRVGYLEAIFDKGKLYYINYLSDNFEKTYVMDYTYADLIQLRYGSGYSIIHQGIPKVEIAPKVTLNVSAGSISPAIIRPGVEVATWTFPPKAGSYTISTNLGQTAKFINTVDVFTCGAVVNDYYVGVLNQPFSGNVSLNDTLCEGTTNKVLDSGFPWNGIVDLNIEEDGTFVLVPGTNFNGIASFTYERRCNDKYIGYGQVFVDYSQGCTDLNPVWIDTANEKCIDCVPYKEQQNTNVECTQGPEYRWIVSSNNTVCTYLDNWQDTNETKCDYAHKYKKQVNINHCASGEKTRWIDLGVNADCECVAEVLINTCCGDPDYYPIVRLLTAPDEENRALQKCLQPNIGETCLKNKLLQFYTLNDGQPHTYVITLLDCNRKIINQLILEDYICAENTNTSSVFDYVFDFNFTQ